MAIVMAAGLSTGTAESHAENPIVKQSSMAFKTDLLTPEALWAMGRIGNVALSPDGQQMVYTVSYYSVEQNKSRSMIYRYDFRQASSQLLTDSEAGLSEAAPAWAKMPNGQTRIAFLCKGQLWSMNSDGSDRQQLTHDDAGIGDFLFAPDGRRVILVKEVEQHTSIAKNDADLPLATGMVINDLMYKHWDHYVMTAPHPFLADVTAKGINAGTDMLAGEPFGIDPGVDRTHKTCQNGIRAGKARCDDGGIDALARIIEAHVAGPRQFAALRPGDAHGHIDTGIEAHGPDGVLLSTHCFFNLRTISQIARTSTAIPSMIH